MDDTQLREKIKNKLEQHENIILILIESLPNLKQSDNSSTDLNNNNTNHVDNQCLLTLSSVVEHSHTSNECLKSDNISSTILKLFAKQLLNVRKLDRTKNVDLYKLYPNLKTWFSLFKVSNCSLTLIHDKVDTFYDLFVKSNSELNELFESLNGTLSFQQIHSICAAFESLKTIYKTLETKPSTSEDASESQNVNRNLTGGSNSNQNDVVNNSQGISAANHNPIATGFEFNMCENANQLHPALSASSSFDSTTANSASNLKTPSSPLPYKIVTNTLSSSSSKLMTNLLPVHFIVNAPQRSKQQRKSESDVQINSVLFNQSNQSNLSSIVSNAAKISPTAENAPVNPKSSAAYAPPNFINTAKTNKKPHKVTTPPPFRKNAIAQVNPSTSATATAAVVVAAAVAVPSGTNATHLPNTSNHHMMTNATTLENLPNQNGSPGSASNINFTRSSSHESHLRNKIEPCDVNQLNQIKMKLNNIKLVSIESTHNDMNPSLNPNSSQKLSSFPSTTPQTPTSLTSKFYSNSNTNSVNEVNINTQSSQFHNDSSTLLTDPHKTSSSSSLYLNGGISYPSHNVRKGSVEGSDSSHGQSGQTSPINMPNSPTRLTSKSAINQSYEDIDGKSVNNNSLSVPKSPKVKEHRWKNTLKVAYCYYCKKRILIGLKCIVCKIRCHRECEKKLSPICPSVAQFPSPTGLIHVPPLPNHHHIDTNNVFLTSVSSGLPSPLLNSSSSQRSMFVASNTKNSNQNDSWHRHNNSSFSAIDEQSNASGSWQSSSVGKFMNRLVNTITTPIQSQRNPKLHNLESKSSSSCNSSEPNSPGIKTVQQMYSSCLSPNLPFQRTNTLQSQSNEFFPKLPSDHSINSRYLSEKREDDSGLSKNGSRPGLDDNQSLEHESGHRVLLNDEAIHAEDSNNDTMNNESDFNQSGYSQDLQQFNITYEEITDKVEIGRGRFSKVYKAQWHGPHAIKEIDLDDITFTDNSEQLTFIKEEVLNLRKTRHTNLILFVGACVKPPVCAIVMSLCRGVCLHKYLHTDSYPKPNIDWTINIAIQIAQGMAYLHNKQMIHKDLRSKNIFIEGNKAVITDFGLYAITRLCKKNLKNGLLPVTKECIYYMAPELIKSLGKPDFDDKFTYASDVFSFGTVWYELFCNEYPFSSNNAHSVIYLIGSGLKNISSSIQIPKEFKAILLKCWSSDMSARPDFSQLLETFRAVPKRKLIRSPSHPQIGRSLETLNVND